MRRRLIPLLCGSVFAAAGAPTVADTAGDGLHPYTATYSVSRGRMRVGEMQVTLARAEHGTWLYESRSRTTGFIGFLRDYRIHEATRFSVQGDAIVPHQHAYTLTGDRRDRNFALEFDWERLTVQGIVEGEAVTAELERGAVDRHTILLSAVLGLRRGATFPHRRVMIDRARAKEVEVRYDGDGDLSTPAGMFRTVRIVQQRIDDPAKRLVLWLATDAQLLPVRVRSVDDDGKTITLELLAFEFP